MTMRYPATHDPQRDTYAGLNTARDLFLFDLIVFVLIPFDIAMGLLNIEAWLIR